MPIQLIVWFSILIPRISFSLLSAHSLASSSLETGACSVFYTNTRGFTKMVLHFQSSVAGITRMLSYVMVLKLVEIFKLVAVVIAFLTAC